MKNGTMWKKKSENEKMQNKNEEKWKDDCKIKINENSKLTK